jgi:hypothetical protein
MKTSDDWRKVGDQFAVIGERFKEHYEKTESSDPEEDASVDEVRSALRTLGDALDHVFTAVGEAFRDPALRTEAKEAAGSIATALGATFNELSEEVRRLVGSETKGETGTATDAGTAATDADTTPPAEPTSPAPSEETPPVTPPIQPPPAAPPEQTPPVTPPDQPPPAAPPEQPPPVTEQDSSQRPEPRPQEPPG